MGTKLSVYHTFVRFERRVRWLKTQATILEFARFCPERQPYPWSHREDSFCRVFHTYAINVPFDVCLESLESYSLTTATVGLGLSSYCDRIIGRPWAIEPVDAGDAVISTILCFHVTYVNQSARAFNCFDDISVIGYETKALCYNELW